MQKTSALDCVQIQSTPNNSNLQGKEKIVRVTKSQRAMCQKTLNWVNHVYLPSQNKEHCIVLQFELSRVELCRKRFEGKCKLVRISGRFELPGFDCIQSCFLCIICASADTKEVDTPEHFHVDIWAQVLVKVNLFLMLVSFAAIIRVVTQCSSPLALHDPNNGCKGHYLNSYPIQHLELICKENNKRIHVNQGFYWYDLQKGQTLQTNFYCTEIEIRSKKCFPVSILPTMRSFCCIKVPLNFFLSFASLSLSFETLWRSAIRS